MRQIDAERDFFDKSAAEILTKESFSGKMPTSEFERYRLTKHATLYEEEKMFSITNQFEGKKLIEVGCGLGINSVRHAYIGKEVTAFDISPVSIEHAKLFAEANGVKVNFQVGDMTQKETLGKEEFDIVWFGWVLHHLVPELDKVMEQTYNTLKPGGLFIACEPVEYARWLKKLARFRPGWKPGMFTPDECPLRPSEFQIIRRYFPNLQMKYYNLSRSHLFFPGNQNTKITRLLRRIDNCLLMIPGMKNLAGYVVMWGYK